jgi:hypothetical protein
MGKYYWILRSASLPRAPKEDFDMSKEQEAQRVAWRPKEWNGAVPVSRAQVTEWLRDGTIPSVKVGGARFITESPRDFIERHRQTTA